MIYFLHGIDTESARVKAHELIASLQKKKPDAAFFNITSETWIASTIDELACGQGLFEKKYIIFVDRVGENKDYREELAEKAELMGESENIFIILEGKLDKATVTKIEKRAEKTQVFDDKDAKGVSAEKEFDGDSSVFALSDALGRRDKKQLWVLYREFIDAGKAPEEIHGTLFWQVKSMILASRTKSAVESGLAPFTYSKSKGFAGNFSEKELRGLLDDLIAISHDARRGKHDLETGLERVLLQI